ncbi:DnaD domain protein [Staphylococcus debuckii]|uniref:DnaD domain-containing protein n=1 Tax=Staphylococcus debuckii TaxID=2044912 RepID=UPI000F434D1C|nr:DnaD domain protein [Staphylococcus debuckii]AYU54654.1 DnaD domain protein [Staphylococcus debuckii]
MDNRLQIKSVIKSFSGRENIIPIPVVYIELLGDYHIAAFLNQLIYWSDKTKRKDGYFYKSYKEWKEELFLSRYQIDKSIDKLKEIGLIKTSLKKANGAPTLHYKVDMDRLTEWICEKLTNGNAKNSQMELSKTDKSLTEITTEITTDSVSESFQYISNHLEIIQSPLKIQEIEELIKDLGNEALDIVKVATDYTRDNNKGINYLIKVLTNWIKEGVDTKEKAENKVKPKTKKQNSNIDGMLDDLVGSDS